MPYVLLLGAFLWGVAGGLCIRFAELGIWMGAWGNRAARACDERARKRLDAVEKKRTD